MLRQAPGQFNAARLAFVRLLRHDDGMFDVAVEKTANLLKVSYVGTVKADEARRCQERILLLLKELQRGFGMLTDFSALEAMDLACAPFIEQVMDACDDAGIKTVVRVFPDPRKDIGLNIMSLFHYSRGVRIVTCRTLEEAQTVLENLAATKAAP
jgi:anti-anti-sigma regulatory factor